MSGFADDLKRFAVKVNTRRQDVFVNFVGAIKDSITDGSAITGSPGQPVESGELKTSWQSVFNSPTDATVMTNLVYAPPNEYGIREDGGPYVQRSPVGGRHSVALTVAGSSRLLEDVTRKAAGS